MKKRLNHIWFSGLTEDQYKLMEIFDNLSIEDQREVGHMITNILIDQDNET